ncbi:unnamed protein product [Caenorhabditis sp. 36 PRJEB53466]|nr:unnamed protein product [Caenorhabditis sp. 36 PRJEB53466]
MVCPVSMVEQFSSYALCSPNMWMIIACTFMTLLTLILTIYLHRGFRRDARSLQFVQWKQQQLANRLRVQEPNVTLLEKITRKMNEKNHEEHTFEDFFHKEKETANPKVGQSESSDGVAAKVQKDKDEDAAKVLRETNMGNTTPAHDTAQDNGTKSILKKWTNATKDMLAIDNESDQSNNRVDNTQDEQN